MAERHVAVSRLMMSLFIDNSKTLTVGLHKLHVFQMIKHQIGFEGAL